MKKIICRFLVVLILFSNLGIYANASSNEVFDFSKGSTYSSWNYYHIAEALVEKYPDLLHFEIIGYSRDKKPIYAIIMTENVQEVMDRDDFYVFREHYYVEAGNHARETVNTAILMKMIEHYCMDYYDDTIIKEFHLKDELKKAVIHFIPLVNPDGFDLVKFGTSHIQTEEAKQLLNSVKDKNYKKFKANLAGVDLNRNFPDVYYDLDTKQWVDKFQKYNNQYYSEVPSGEFYAGPYAGSEPETQAIMAYVKRYDFRNFISYHSQGEVIYHDRYWFSQDVKDRELAFAEVLGKVSGYMLINKITPDSGKGSGFFGDYAVSETLKPAVTVETTKNSMPTEQKYYQKAYNQTYLLPLYAVKHGREVGYFKYRLYVDGVYVRDFNELVYAEAHASKYENSLIIEATGVPKYKLLTKPMTRTEAVTTLISKYYDLTNLTVNALDTFSDNKDIIITFAKNQNIVYGSDGNFNGQELVSPYEVAVILYRIHNNLGYIQNNEYQNYVLKNDYPDWAKDSIKFVLHNNMMEEYMFKFNKCSHDWIK